MYLATQEICDSRGMPAYEVSNHARPGAESQHKLIYWRYGDYVGIGPGAHGRITSQGRKLATETYLAPNTWISAVSAGSGESHREELSRSDQANEYLMMGLRIAEGLDVDRFKLLSGTSLDQDKVDDLCEIGMLYQEDNRIKATRDGRAVLNAVIRELLG